MFESKLVEFNDDVCLIDCCVNDNDLYVITRHGIFMSYEANHYYYKLSVFNLNNNIEKYNKIIEFSPKTTISQILNNTLFFINDDNIVYRELDSNSINSLGVRATSLHVIDDELYYIDFSETKLINYNTKKVLFEICESDKLSIQENTLYTTKYSNFTCFDNYIVVYDVEVNQYLKYNTDSKIYTIGKLYESNNEVHEYYVIRGDDKKLYYNLINGETKKCDKYIFDFETEKNIDFNIETNISDENDTTYIGGFKCEFGNNVVDNYIVINGKTLNRFTDLSKVLGELDIESFVNALNPKNKDKIFESLINKDSVPNIINFLINNNDINIELSFTYLEYLYINKQYKQVNDLLKVILNKYSKQEFLSMLTTYNDFNKYIISELINYASRGSLNFALQN